MTEDRVALTPALLAEDSLIFGLRMNDGVDLAALRERYPRAPWASVDEVVQRLVGDALATGVDHRLRLTTRGRLMADAVGAAIMEAMANEVPAV